jgi:beta-glucan synthesis-associated protein KRE6
MILYRIASEDDNAALIPPRSTMYKRDRDSLVSASEDQSIFSLSSDSKYPSGLLTHTRGLVPYAYDPDTEVATDEDDFLHAPDTKEQQGIDVWSSRGWLNVGALMLLTLALLALFICYPVLSYYNSNSYNRLISSNTHINSTGQANSFQNPGGAFALPSLIDPDTPSDVLGRTGWDGQEYTLVFSDEFNKDGRTFYPGDDPYWEAVDLWYGVTADQEWYDPSQLTTKGGALQILLEQVSDPTLNHGLPYKSGMLQSWNKFCFTSGYIEASVTFPGPNSNTQGYVSFLSLSLVLFRCELLLVAWSLDYGQSRATWL